VERALKKNEAIGCLLTARPDAFLHILAAVIFCLDHIRRQSVIQSRLPRGCQPDAEIERRLERAKTLQLCKIMHSARIMLPTPS